MTGTVKWYAGRFGFVMAHDLGPDVFVHVDSLRGASRLETGMEVDLDVHPTYRHPKTGTRRALAVRVLDKRNYVPIDDYQPRRKAAAYGD